MTELQELLNQASDIVLLEKHPDENRYRFAFPFTGPFARECYQASLELDPGLPEFQGYWEFNEQTSQINGSSIPLLARLMKILSPQGLEISDAKDLLELARQGKLSNGVYRNCGIAVYSDDEPNRETARALIGKAKQEGLELPLLYPPRDLDYLVSDNHAKIISVDNPRRVVSGEQAEEILRNFYKGSRGACSVYRSRNGHWNADCDDFADSLSGGFVDFVCAEGTRENLIEGYNHLIARKYDSKKEKLKRQIAQIDTLRKAEKRKILEALRA